MNYFITTPKKKQYIVIWGDILTVLLAIIFAYLLKWFFIQQNISFSNLLSRIGIIHFVILTVQILFLYLCGLYNHNKFIISYEIITNVLLSIFLSSCVVGLILYFVPKYIFGRQLFTYYTIIVFLLLICFRVFIYKYFIISNSNNNYLFIGNKDNIEKYISDIKTFFNINESSYSLCIVDNLTAENDDGNHLVSDVDPMGFDSVIFDINHTSYDHWQVSTIVKARFMEKELQDFPSYFQYMTGRVPLDYINGQWLLSRESLQGRSNKFYDRVKRGLDIFGSLLLLVVTAPIWLLVFIMIKSDSRGPVFFIQERLGKNRIPFNCYKFRSMVQDAEAVSGPVWASDEDLRITRVGKFLRKTRIDELPQLVNILRGEMSFIGPRPIRSHFARQFEETIPYYNLRFWVQPGLSGWAQVSHDYAGSKEGQVKKFEYELFYVLNKSFALDMIIVLKTLKTIVRAQGK